MDQNMTEKQLDALQRAAADGSADMHANTRRALVAHGWLGDDGITQLGLEALDARGIV